MARPIQLVQDAFSEDAQQQAYGFLMGQLESHEAEVYERPYPMIRYMELVPVDTSASEWAQGITWVSADGYGEADFIGKYGQDFPVVNRSKEKHSILVDTLGASYEYTLQDLRTAMMMGQDISSENVELVFRVMEEKIDSIVLDGVESLKWDPLWNKTGVPNVPIPNNAADDSKLWTDKTGYEIAKDCFFILSAVHKNSKTVYMADTLLIPDDAYNYIVATTLHGGTDTTIFDFVSRANPYTARTGNRLMIRSVRGIDKAGPGGVGRIMAYTRDSRVLKFHLPMATRFLPVFQKNPLTWVHAAMFRCAGLEMRLLAAMAYADGVTPAE